MKPTKAASAEDFTLLSTFEAVRQQLLNTQNKDHFEKPLAHWALPKDRRLPYALLDRRVADIIATSFRDLSATPGIGHKKIASLVMLLHRVLTQEPRPAASVAESVESASDSEGKDAFEPAAVSESMWEEWRATVRRFGLEQEKLGRLAPSLRALPSVVWETPLSAYLDRSVDEIRGLKTHGDKRVRVILEVFHTVHHLLGSAGRDRHFSLRLVPRFVAPLEHWITEELQHGNIPDVQDIRQQLVLPLLNQIALDAGETVHRLAAGRLAVEGPVESVREQARRMGVTRARVYQLLEMCARVMAVRWPEGKWQLSVLAKKFAGLPLQDERAVLFRDTCAVVYPERQTVVTSERVPVESIS